MRYAALALAGTLLAVSPVLAQDSGNASQPSRTVPQSGQTSGGPLDTPPGAGGAATTGSVGSPAGAPGTGATDSAKGGNSDQTNKMAPNAGGTAGGPAR
ncbi:hypothetical protein [uncultured Methylobacterium sp.]|uniref:hypothetical protein n=1 Tax=uncultured Methylobacterium sp. TaxID=157278 RepID=UPI0035CB829A